MPQQSIAVVGSSNTDMVIQTDAFPLPGQTLLGGRFFMFQGGKGANQAVAAARLKGDVYFIARVGDDIFGKQALKGFESEGIHTASIIKDLEASTGVAMITVNASGENTIVVAQGANANLSGQDIKTAEEAIRRASIILTQLEIPMDTVMTVASMAARYQKKLILNPAPAAILPREIFPLLHIITPNETEASTLIGVTIIDKQTTQRAAYALKDLGTENVIITLGSSGAFVLTKDEERFVPAPKVKAVDTTAAGDVFNGALAVALSEGQSIVEAVSFANQAAALSVTRMGAQASAPYRHELN